MISHGCLQPITDGLLVINGTEEWLQIALGTGDTLVQFRETRTPGTLIRHLAPQVQDMVKSSGADPENITSLACVRGPGSFTGLRIVLASIFGLARGWNRPMGGLDYLPLLAQGPADFLEGELWVMTHARQRQVYFQGFFCPGASPIGPCTCLHLEQVEKLLSTTKNPPCILGSGIRRNQDFFSGLSPSSFHLLPPRWDRPSPDTLFTAAKNIPKSHNPVEPLYLRPSDAEENLEAICRKRGIDVQDARKSIPDFLTPFSE